MVSEEAGFVDGGVHDFFEGGFECVGGVVAALVGDAGEGMGVVGAGYVGEEGGGVFDAEGVEVVGEGGAVESVDGVDDLVL